MLSIKKGCDIHDHQYFFEKTKNDEIKHSCFYFTLDDIIFGLNV